MTVHQSLDLREIQTIYNTDATAYDSIMTFQDRLGLGKIRASLLRKASGAVLEVAIGAGASLPYYPAGCTITGVDAAQGMLSVAAHKAQRLGRDLRLACADAHALPFPDGSFDTVVSMLAGCTFADQRAAFRELARVCKKGGRVLLLEHVRVNRAPFGQLQDAITPLMIRRHGCHQNRNTVSGVAASGLRITGLRQALGGYLQLIEATPSR